MKPEPTAGEAASSVSWSRILWIAAFALTAAGTAVPFFLVHAPPLLDYPNHLARTFILAHLHAPGFHFAGLYTADLKLYPYILWDLLATALQQGMPAESAGKLLLALATVLLPVGVAFFVRQANPGSLPLAFLGCALAWCTLFLWGFTAYHLSVGLCFVMAGCWLWYRRRPSPLRAALFLASCLAAYFAHLLGFASAAFILLFYVLTQWNWREWLRLAAFLSPPSLLFLWARPGLGEHRVEWRPVAGKLEALRNIPTDGYNLRLDRMFIAGLVLCFLAAVVGNRELRLNRRWAVVWVAFLAVYLLLPDGWGTSSDIDVRLVMPLWLLGLAVLHVGRRARWVAALAVGLTVLRVVNVAGGFRAEAERQPAMDRGIAHIARGSRIFPVVDTCDDQDPKDYYYVHYWAYAVIRRGAVSPYLFDIPGQTPMRIPWQPYMADGYWQHCYDTEPEWKRVAAGYDYIWSYGDQRFARGISEVADLVYREAPLVLYHIRR
jgi:hypothetical protein